MTDEDALIYVRHWLDVDGQALLEVCAGGEPGVAGKEGRDVFSVGSSAERDHRFAIVLPDSVGACEGWCECGFSV